MTSKLKHSLILLFIVLVSFPFATFGRIGVGVGTGKIQIEKPLKAGDVHELEFSVINTGNEPGSYGVSVEYQEDSLGMKPPREWFSFYPQSFDLRPDEDQTVKVTINIPDRFEPGDYFAYLEGHPVKKSVSGQTSIGVAAATKLYFTVEPDGIFQKAYYDLVRSYGPYRQWGVVVLGVIIGIILFFILRRFKFKITRKKPH